MKQYLQLRYSSVFFTPPHQSKNIFKQVEWIFCLRIAWLSTEEQLKGMARHFEKVKAAADTFIQWANRKLQERDEQTDLELETTLSTKRVNTGLVSIIKLWIQL